MVRGATNEKRAARRDDKAGLSGATPPRFAAPAVRAGTTPGLVWPALPEPPAGDILVLLHQMERSQWWPEARLRDAQFSQLGRLLDHARRTVPYYRDNPGYDVLRRGETLTPEAWAALPILTRRQAQELGVALHSDALPVGHGEVIPLTTSGSTGMPLRSLKTAISMSFYDAATLREARWHRRDVSGRFAAIKPHFGKTAGTIGEELDNWGDPYSRLFPTGPGFALGIFGDPADQLRWLREVKPDYLLSMPSNTRAIARHAQAHGIAMPPIREVRSYGEAFEDDLPRLCREVWGAKHTTIYSAEESGMIASQCPKRPHLHCEAELAMVEVLDDSGRPCAPGEVGRVVVTHLHNFAAPLIRYELGDLAEVGMACECGRGLPVLKRVLGRTSGLLTLPSGEKRFVEPATRTFVELSAVVQRQIVQRSPTEIDLVLVARRPLTVGEETELFSDLSARFGAKFDFRTVYVDSIPRAASGKFALFRSEIPDK